MNNICDFVREEYEAASTELKAGQPNLENVHKIPIDPQVIEDNVETLSLMSVKNSKKNSRFNHIDRVSSKTACKLRSLVDPIVNAKYSLGKIVAMCYLCDTKCEGSLHEWKSHILQHTGEKEFCCSRCHAELSSNKTAHCAGGSVLTLFSEPHLQAYLCSICNYLKVDDVSVNRHIRKEHKKSWNETKQYMEKVTLLPDLSQRQSPISSQYKYAAAATRYNCNVEHCNTICDSEDDLEYHFKYRHTKINVFHCPHCSEDVNITDRAYLAITKHLYLHSSELYKCDTCVSQFIGDKKLVNHSVFHHTNDECKFLRDNRSIVSRTEDLQDVIILFECDLCTARFRIYSNAVEHYIRCHQSIHVNFTLIQLFKRMNFDKTIKWSRPVEWKAYCQQLFSCGWCDHLLNSKGKLIRHHGIDGCKSGRELSLKIETDFSIKYPNLTNKNPKFDQYLLYFCGHCANRTMYANVDQVYDHWTKHHANNTSKSFRFEIAQLAKCRYCDAISTFDGLKMHQHYEHPTKQFAIQNLFDANKCGLCASDCDRALIRHFEQNHKMILSTNVFDPIVLTDNVLKELVNVEGHKKFKCGRCMKMFETNEAFCKHHDREHYSLKACSERVYDNKSVHTICELCQDKIEPNQLFSHLKVHNIVSVDLLKKFFLEAKVLFGNGLVLNKLNLLGTKYDDCEEID